MNNISKCCRLCLSVTSDSFNFQVDTVFQNRFMKIFRFELEDKGEPKRFPKIVCQKCYSTLNSFHDFYETVLENKAKIEEIVEEEKKLPTVNIVESSPEPDSKRVRDLIEKSLQESSSNGPKTEGTCLVYEGEINEDPKKLPKARKTIIMDPNPDRLLSKVYNLCCSRCQDLKFETFEQLDNHYINIHKEKGYIKCCQQIFRSKSMALDHAEWHMNPVIFDCAFNCADFTDRKSLREHENVCKFLEKFKYYRCNVCSASFFTEFEQGSHNENMHKSSAKSNPPPPKPKPKPKPQQTDSRRFKGMLKNPYSMVPTKPISVVTNRSSTQDNRNQCTNCYQNFSSYKKLKNHLYYAHPKNYF